MRFLQLLLITLSMLSCFDQSTNARLMSGASQGGTTEEVAPVDPNGNLCRHKDANNYKVQCTDDAGHCYFYACKDERYVEFGKYEEYQAYVDKFGGEVFSDPSLCKNLKEEGKGCAHPDGLNFVEGGATEKGPCDFEACIDPKYQEYTQYLLYKEYTDQYGGKIYPSEQLCKIEVGGCKLDSPYVTNYNPTATAENGSCNFKGCLDKQYIEYDEELATIIADYKKSLEDAGLVHTGLVESSCVGKIGCTIKDATNYTSGATVDDGTCQISCCSLEGHENYDKDCKGRIDAYKDLLNSEGTQLSGTLNLEYQCGQKFDCAFDDPRVTNYEKDSKENGTCNIRCCSDKDAENYDSECESSAAQYLGTLATAGITYTGTFDKNYGCVKLDPGCTFDSGYVTNYEPNRKENGSCEIKCCAKEGYENYSAQCQETVDEYDEILSDLGLTKLFDPVTDYMCGKKLGCNDPKASNYDADALENGTCNFTCCTDINYENYDGQCSSNIDAYLGKLLQDGIKHTGSINKHACSVKLGCTDKDAVNYDPTAEKENGTCSFQCCGTETSENYDPECQPNIDEYVDYLAGLNITLKGNLNNKFNCGKDKGCNYNNDLVSNYTANTAEDGSCIIECCSKEGYSNSSEECKSAIDGYKNILLSLGLTSSGTLNAHDCEMKLGCKDSNATNYDPTAQKEDGSCIFACTKCPAGYSGTDSECIKEYEDYKSLVSGLGLNAEPLRTDTNQCKKKGCTYNKCGSSYIDNYSPDHKEEDGSCNIKCCSKEGYENYDSNCQTHINDYQSFLASLGLSSTGTLDNEYNCGKKLACSYNKPGYVINYEPGTKENATCDIQCCSDPNSENYDKNCQAEIDKHAKYLADLGLTPKGNINNKYNCGKQLDCNFNNPLVSNYVPNTKEDGSCNIGCCEDTKYENFNKNCSSAISSYKDLLKKDGISLTGTLNGNYQCGKLLGCTYEGAEKYHPDYKENGSCSIKCCSKEGYENYDANCRSNVDGYQTLLAKLGLMPNGGIIDDEYKCGKKLGCAYDKTEYVQNLEVGTKENGSCDIKCCAKEGYENFDEKCAGYLSDYQEVLKSLGINLSGTLVSDYQCGKKLGCMDDKAYNFDPTAQLDDKSCKFKACNKPGTVNYDKDKEIRDAFENYGHGQLEPADCGKFYGCNFPKAKNYNADFQENGSCEFEGCNKKTYANFNEDFDSIIKEYKDKLMSLDPKVTYNGKVSILCEGLLGCTVSQAVNYNSEAEVDDKSCKFKGCIDSKAYNYDEVLDKIVTNYGGSISDSDSTCKFDPNYACLCDATGSATNFSSQDELKALMITDQAILSSIQDGLVGGEVNLGRALGALSINGSNTNSIIQSYIDGYRFEELQHLEAEARDNIAEVIENHWAKSRLASGYDIDGAPYQLLAVVFRPDLMKFDGNKLVSAGEGRLIFKLNQGLTKKTMVPCTKTVTNTTSNCRSRYGCRPTTTTTTVQAMCEKDVPLDRPSHVIFEYDLPVNGKLSKNDWHYHWAKLKCLEGMEYKTQLRNLIESFAFTKYKYKDCKAPTRKGVYGHTTEPSECGRTIVPLSQVRVNDFGESTFDPSAPWAIFEMKPLGSGNRLQRVKMPHTPLDLAAKETDIRHWNQEFVSADLVRVVNDFKGQFNDISDPFKGYSVEHNAIQNSYGLNASWAEELKDHPMIKVLPDPEKSFSLYRYSLNTCNGCHSGAFTSHDDLNLDSPAVLNKYGQLRFSTITEANDFLHVHADGSLSDFVLEDLGYRSDDLEVSLSDSYCRSPGSYSELESSINAGQFACDLDFNNDGKLTEMDSDQYEKLLTNARLHPCFRLPDLNGDGRADMVDVQLLATLVQQNDPVQASQIARTCRDITVGPCEEEIPNCDKDQRMIQVSSEKFVCLQETAICDFGEVVREDASGKIACVRDTKECRDGEILVTTSSGLRKCETITKLPPVTDGECSDREILVQGKCIPKVVNPVDVDCKSPLIKVNNECVKPVVSTPTCPSGTKLMGDTCQSICSSGTIWTGRSCTSVCASNFIFSNGRCIQKSDAGSQGISGR